MPWREHLEPRRMARVAIVAPSPRWRAVLAAVADSGAVEPELPAGTVTGPASEALARLRRSAPEAEAHPVVGPEPPDLDPKRPEPPMDEVAGEVELERATLAAASRDGVVALAGWAPASSVSELNEVLSPLGGAVVELEMPQGVQPPTALAPRGSAEPFRPLVETYATVPYRDVDPTWFAAFTYVVMFGMMFGDAGQGALLAGGALWVRLSQATLALRLRRVWLLLAALGVSSCFFGFLYGEFFGPTDVIPTLWLSPLDEPIRFLGAAIAIGGGLLAVSYLIGILNRWREGGLGYALYSSSGIAGSAVFGGGALVALGVLGDIAALWIAGLVLAVAGLVLAWIGLRAASGPGAAGVTQAVVELFDLVLRLLSNVVSFARLAAFGLTHAALGLVIWDATTALWDRGGLGFAAAVVVFVAGNALAFALEALVAGVQALRLEYYELFSRVFATEGRPFRPWHVPSVSNKEHECLPG